MRARTFLSAAALLTSGACTSLPKAEQAPTPALVSGEAPGLAVWTAATDAAVGSALSGVTYFSVNRDAYAAAFTVTRDGRLRVVWPESPRDDGLVQAGKTYRANGSFAQYGSYMTGARNAVPYVFVLVSEQRLDLTKFGSGGRWRYQVDLADLGRYAEDAIQSVASVVLPSPEASYAADYAFVTPRLTGAAQMLAMYCGVRNADARNYDYFRDLWATFDPWDSWLGPVSFASSWAFWPGAMFPFSSRGSAMGFYADRASRASAAFWTGCPAITPYYGRSLALAYAPFQAGTGFVTPVLGTPGMPAPVDSGKPGDPLRRVGPNSVFGGPGVAVAAATDETAERRARLRERIETRREERGRVAGAAAGRAALRTERLTALDVTRFEGRVRAQERAELGISDLAERRAGRAGAGRAGGMPRGDGLGAGADPSGRVTRGVDRSGTGRSGVARGSVDAGGAGGAARGATAGVTGGESRGASESRGGGESRGSGEGGRTRQPQ